MTLGHTYLSTCCYKTPFSLAPFTTPPSALQCERHSLCICTLQWKRRKTQGIKMPASLCGTWDITSNDNFEGYMIALGKLFPSCINPKIIWLQICAWLYHRNITMRLQQCYLWDLCTFMSVYLFRHQPLFEKDCCEAEAEEGDWTTGERPVYHQNDQPFS